MTTSKYLPIVTRHLAILTILCTCSLGTAGQNKADEKEPRSKAPTKKEEKFDWRYKKEELADGETSHLVHASIWDASGKKILGQCSINYLMVGEDDSFFQFLGMRFEGDSNMAWRLETSDAGGGYVAYVYDKVTAKLFGAIHLNHKGIATKAKGDALTQAKEMTKFETRNKPKK